MSLVAQKKPASFPPISSLTPEEQVMVGNWELPKVNRIRQSFIFSFLSNQDLRSLAVNKARRFVVRSIKNSYIADNMLRANPYQFFLNVRTNKDIYAPASIPFQKSFFSLMFCPCPHLTPEGREFLVTNSMDLLTQNQHPKNSPLKIVSVGPGGCYQELVLLKRLAEAGYEQIQLILIDNNKVPLDGLSDYCSNYMPKCKINIAYFNSLESYGKYIYNVHNMTSEEEFDFTTVKDDFKPDLLLLLDIANCDVDKNITGPIRQTPLSEYSFKLFKHLGLVKQKTVIAYTDRNKKDANIREPFAKCGYAEQHTQLSEVQSRTLAMPEFDLRQFS